MFPFIQCQCFDKRRGVYFVEKVSVFIKIRMLFWPEISALGVFFNFDNERMRPPQYPSAPPPGDERTEDVTETQPRGRSGSNTQGSKDKQSGRGSRKRGGHNSSKETIWESVHGEVVGQLQVAPLWKVWRCHVLPVVQRARQGWRMVYNGDQQLQVDLRTSY